MSVSSLPLIRLILPAAAGLRCVTGASKPQVSPEVTVITKLQPDPSTSAPRCIL